MKKTDAIVAVMPEVVLDNARSELIKVGLSIGKVIEKAHVSRARIIQGLLDYAKANGIGRKPFIDGTYNEVLVPAREGGAFPELGESALRNYKTSLGIAFDYGVPFQAGLFNKPEYRRAKAKPEVEGESLEVGEGLAADKRAGKKPSVPKVATRWEVSEHATVTVALLRALGDMEVADIIQEVLEDNNYWAIPKQ